MTIEKQSKYSEKRENNKEELLKKLALDIAEKYSLKLSETQKLIQADTLVSLDTLKHELQNNEVYTDILKDQKLEELFFSLKGAFELTEEMSKLKIQVLKDELEKFHDIEKNKHTLENLFPKNMIHTAKSPQFIHEHILSASLGVMATSVTGLDILYRLGIGIIKSPYDIYMMVTGRGEMKSWKQI